MVEAPRPLKRSRGTLKALSGEVRRPDSIARRLRLREVRIARARSLSLDEATGKAGRDRDRVNGLFAVQFSRAWRWSPHNRVSRILGWRESRVPVSMV